MTSARSLASITLGLVLLCQIAYARLWMNDFIDLDDEKYITLNSHVNDGLTTENIAWAWTTNYTGFWFPLVWMSLQFDGTLSHILGSENGLLPAVYHGQNLFWHSATTILIVLALTRMTGRLWPSALVAALFAVHPLHVESVAWATERKDVLSGFLWMQTVFLYVRYAEHPTNGRYAVVFVSLVLGLLAKPMLVTLPFALLLLDYWPLCRFGWRLSRNKDAVDRPDGEPARIPGISRSLGEIQHAQVELLPGTRAIILEKIPLVLLAIAGSVLAIQTQSHEGALVALTDLSIPSRIANAAISYAWYLDKTIWPDELAAFYSHPMNNWTWPPVLISFAMLIAISVGAFTLARRAPWLLVGWLWFLGTLVPVIGFFQAGGQARADRFVYIPHIGLFVAIVWSAIALMERERIGLVLKAVLAATCVLAFTTATIIQVGYWKNPYTLWTHVLVATPENDLAHALLGRFWMQQYRATGNEEYLKTGTIHLREAVRIRPGDAEYQCNFGESLLLRGELDEAERHFRLALEGKPDYDDAQYYLEICARNWSQRGLSAGRKGEWNRAIAAHDRAYKAAVAVIKPGPELSSYVRRLAYALHSADRIAEAQSLYTSSSTMDPDWPTRTLEAAWKLATSAELSPADAAMAFELACEVRQATATPSVRALDVLAAALAGVGRYEEAVVICRRALMLAAPEQTGPIAERLALYEQKQRYVGK